VKKYKNGFVLGKFMPLHAGHIFLIETAQASSERLTILLCSQPDDPIPGILRFEWLEKQFPYANVVHHPKPLPRDQANPLFWDLWRRSIQEHCPGQSFDAVFSSEAYGPRLAEALKARHVEVDLPRAAFPVSGTDIRTDPKAFQQYIPEIVRPYYQKYL
jgi:HTH-type transcriptional repressor of NAD biosynthesis genes